MPIGGHVDFTLARNVKHSSMSGVFITQHPVIQHASRMIIPNKLHYVKKGKPR